MTHQYVGKMKFSRYIESIPTIIIPLFRVDCKDASGPILVGAAYKSGQQNLFDLPQGRR